MGHRFHAATFQGTRFRNGKTPVLHLASPAELDDAQQRYKLDYINQLNRRASRNACGRLRSRSAHRRLRTLSHAGRDAGAVDLTQETEATQSLGLDDKTTSAFGRNCLLARRLVERGVRFVQLYSGSGSQWDAHSKIEENHSRLCRSTDKPVAGLLKDLKNRGMLDQTLVIWGGEFGRTPMSEKGDGAITTRTVSRCGWPGAGLPGKVVGATDDFGLKQSNAGCTCAICTPRSSSSWASTTRSSCTCTRASRTPHGQRRACDRRRSRVMVELQSTAGGIILPVHAAGARRTPLRAFTRDDSGRRHPAPERKSQSSAVKLLAELLDVKRSQITLFAGETSHQKFLIAGIDLASLQQRLAILLHPGAQSQ